MGLAFSPDGKHLAGGIGTPVYTIGAAEAPGLVKVWDAQTGQELFTLRVHSRSVNSVVFSQDGKRLASLGIHASRGQASEVKVWDAETGQEVFTVESPAYPYEQQTVAYSPDGKRLACGGRDVKLWDAQSGQELRVLKGGGPSVAFSPDGKRLASGGKVWDAQTGQELLAFKGGHADYVLSVAFSPDGKRLVSASRDGMVKVWDVQTGQDLLSLNGHTAGVESLASSQRPPTGKRLAGRHGDDLGRHAAAGEVSRPAACRGTRQRTMKVGR